MVSHRPFLVLFSILISFVASSRYGLISTCASNLAHFTIGHIRRRATQHTATGTRLGNVTITGTSGARTVAAADFFVGLLTTALQAHELITAIDVPTLVLQHAEDNWVPVELGLAQDEFVEITKGLKGDELVVVSVTNAAQ